jgi:hypothetical protein
MEQAAEPAARAHDRVSWIPGTDAIQATASDDISFSMWHTTAPGRSK